jgi:hypothetical protein
VERRVTSRRFTEARIFIRSPSVGLPASGETYPSFLPLNGFGKKALEIRTEQGLDLDFGCCVWRVR